MRHVIPPKNVKRVYSRSQARSRRPLLFRRGRSRTRRAIVLDDHYEEKRRRSMPKSVTLTVGIIAAALLIQSIFRLPFLRISNIAVEGLRYLEDDTVREFVLKDLDRRRFVIFKNKNYFLVSKKRLAQRLEDEYFLSIASIEKGFPNRLKLEARERVAGFVLQTPDQYIRIDSTGAWVGEVSGPQGLQGVIADEREIIGASIPIEYLEKATIIKDAWAVALPNVELEKFHLSDDDTVISVSTNFGFRVLFSPDKDLEPQLVRLAVYIQETDIDEPREYIDLRFDESLYIK